MRIKVQGTRLKAKVTIMSNDKIYMTNELLTIVGSPVRIIMFN